MAMQGQGFGAHSTNNGNSTSRNGQFGVPAQKPKIVAVSWTPEEQAILEQALPLWSSEPNLVRYARIAVRLKNKGVRDVALRCRWMAKREIARRMKEAMNYQKMNARKGGSCYGYRWAPY